MGRAEARQARQRGARRAKKAGGIRGFLTLRAARHVPRAVPARHGRVRRDLFPGPGADGQRAGRDAEQRLQVQRRHRPGAHRRDQPGDSRPGEGPQGRPAGLRRRREQVLLQRLRSRRQGHRPRPDEHPLGQGQTGWFDHHPAVREELLPGPGPDGQPQAQGTGDLAQGRPADGQERDPRRVHEHQLLRARRVRHPGGGPGVLRRGRHQAERRAGRVSGGAPPGPQPVRLDAGHRDRQEARHRALELRPEQHGRGELAGRRRARRAEVPRTAEAQARPRRGGTGRLSRRGGQQRAGAAGCRQGGHRRRRLDDHPQRRQEAAEGTRRRRRQAAGVQARPQEEQGRRDRAGGCHVRRPEDRRGGRALRRGRRHPALDQQRHTHRLPARLDLQARRARLGAGERVQDAGRREDRAQDGLRRHEQAAGRRERHPSRRRTRTTATTATSPSSGRPTTPSTRSSRRWSSTSAPGT